MSLSINPNVFIICGMLRSGSTLVYQLTCAILEKHGPLRRAGFLPPEQSWPKGPDNSATCAVKLHHFDETLAAMAVEGSGLALYTYRDPRAVVPSAMRQFDISFDKAVQWVTHATRVGTQWESLPATISLRYEDSAKDVQQLVACLCAHMKVNVDFQTIAAIADDHTRVKQSERASQIAKGTYNPLSLLHNGHIGSLDSDSATLQLSAHEISCIETRLGDWMRKHAYLPTLSL
jgi:hypothetical protein